MYRKLFLLLLTLVVVLAFLVRIVPLLGNNFFFTIDQGRDMVYVRDIVERHQLIKKGPETTIPGIFVGPGWYYFLALGYLISSGHPVSGVILMILLSLITLVLISLHFKKELGELKTLLLVVAVSIFWPFYTTSRYAFNPFPTVLLCISLFIFLTKAFQGKKRYYALCLIPIGLSFNSDLASAAVLTILFACVGLFLAITKKLSFKYYLVTTYFLPGGMALFVVKQILAIAKSPDQLQNARGIFSGTSFTSMAANFAEIVKVSIVPQSLIIGIIILVAICSLYVKSKNTTKQINAFGLLTLSLFIISYLFFSTNKGWKDWHTLFLPTTIYITLLAMTLRLKKHFAIPLVGILFVSQLIVFVPRYNQYLTKDSDSSLLANQLQVIDWIYAQSEENGFNVYTYMTNSYFDYPYQYLFWWHGKGKYGHIPCHYEVYPKSHKFIYVPGGEFNYNTPTLGCDQIMFLIKEPVKDEERYEKWLANFPNTNLIETTTIGKLTVEKRYYIK